MLSNDRKQINLLHPVREDTRLLKHKKFSDHLTDAGVDLYQRSEAEEAFENSMNNPNTSDGFGSGWGRNPSDNIWDGIPFSVQREYNSPLMRKAMEYYIKFRLLLDKPTKDPVDMFEDVKNNFKELENAPDAEMKKVVELLKLLERTKQVAAAKSVKSKQYLIRAENILFNAGFNQYQTEESLIGFIVQCKKGLCLTEIENFERPIPSDVVEKIEAAEQLKVFDNYYILHYDPSGAVNQYLNANITTKPKPKDPIVFGVIRNSTKLYYVADWIDQYCNLTYKDILAQGVDMKLELQSETES